MPSQYHLEHSLHKGQGDMAGGLVPAGFTVEIAGWHHPKVLYQGQWTPPLATPLYVTPLQTRCIFFLSPPAILCFLLSASHHMATLWSIPSIKTGIVTFWPSPTPTLLTPRNWSWTAGQASLSPETSTERVCTNGSSLLCTTEVWSFRLMWWQAVAMPQFNLIFLCYEADVATGCHSCPFIPDAVFFSFDSWVDFLRNQEFGPLY